MHAIKTISKIIIILIILIALVIAGYVIYLSKTYYRIDDNQELEIENNVSSLIKTNEEYSAITYNIGFGAYTPTYDFFMDEGVMNDGTKTKGTHAKAVSEESAYNTTLGSASIIKNLDADFTLLQEVDTDSDRSYHINQKQVITDSMKNCAYTYATNLHTAKLLYPPSDPIGTMNSGILTLSSYKIDSSLRRSYPIATSFISKFFDLDRCFDVMRLPVKGTDKELVLINSHMSAYDEGGYYRAQQLNLICGVMKEEADKGNWVIAGGDWNHALCGSETMYPSKQQQPDWLVTFDIDALPKGFSIVKANNIKDVASCRSDDIPYEKGVTYCATVDGFIVSSNVKAKAQNIDCEFKYSDHNPVKLTFELS